MSWSLPADLGAAVEGRDPGLGRGRPGASALGAEPTLWTGTDEPDWLGWLDIARQELAERGRRVLRVHLGKDVKGGLAELARAVDQTLR
jgi:hypothetical protein